MEETQLPLRPAQPATDHLLEDLMALTNLFNPERIWQEEEQLDDMDENEVQRSDGAAKPE